MASEQYIKNLKLWRPHDWQKFLTPDRHGRLTEEDIQKYCSPKKFANKIEIDKIDPKTKLGD
jgi:hypothetical protein